MLGMGFLHIAHYLTLLSGSRKHFRAFGSVDCRTQSHRKITGVLGDTCSGAPLWAGQSCVVQVCVY